jgi:hypothetical protein
MEIENTLVPTDEGTYIELDPEGTPLGEWRWSPDDGTWIFEELPPMGDYPPRTGDELSVVWTALFVTGAGTLATIIVSPRRRRR